MGVPCISPKLPLFKGWISTIDQNQLTKRKKEIGVVREVTSNDKWEALVFLAASDESSKVGTFKRLEASGESIFEFAKVGKNVIYFYLNNLVEFTVVAIIECSNVNESQWRSKSVVV